MFPTRAPSIVRLLLLALGLSLSALPAIAQGSSALPDAPRPSVPAPNADDATGIGSSRPAPYAPRPLLHAPLAKRKWAQFIDPGERVPPLDTRDKWRFWLVNETRPTSPLPTFLSAGYGQLTDVPQYGSDSGAFGDRLGAAFLRDASMRFFCDSFFPVLTREDPRYERKAHGSYQARATWAAEHALIARNDNGSHGFNSSDVFGHLAASLLTLAYYPPPDVRASMVLRTWGTSVAGKAANNLFLEFWPDVIIGWRHHRERVRERRSAESTQSP